MKVLLTGANGFVGSHILDCLLARDVATAVLLRPSADRRFIAAQLARVEVCTGTLDDERQLDRAMAGVTHVIHCAGSTKALRPEDFERVNRLGTRGIVAAINRQGGHLRRLVHISSLAAGGPALPDRPAREDDPPRPVSVYGRSKLAGEDEVRSGCRSEYVILRPPAVYGPRDMEFLRLFRAVRAHLHPRPRPQPLSFVFVRDLAEAAVACLQPPAAAGKTFYVAATEVNTAATMAGEIAAQMNRWTIPLPVPTPLLWLLGSLQDVLSSLTRRPNVLSRRKYPELRAPGWVCDPGRLQQDLGLVCPTTLRQGIAETLAWYRRQGWL